MAKELFEDCNGAHVISSSKNLWQKASGFCRQSRLACLSRILDELNALHVVFVQAETEIFNGHAVMLLTNSKTKILSQELPNVLYQDLWILPSKPFALPQPIFFSVCQTLGLSFFFKNLFRTVKLFITLGNSQLKWPWCEDCQAHSLGRLFHSLLHKNRGRFSWAPPVHSFQFFGHGPIALPKIS